MIKRVVLTGGPGSGKTSVLTSIVKHFQSSDYKVLVVPETATELINGGVKCFGDNAISLIDFQEIVLRLQLEKEALYEKAAECLGDNVLIIYDRGTVDNCAYMSDEEFKEVLNRLGNITNKQELLDRYDLVINLVSRKDFYTTENNQARSEGVEEALALGVTTLNTWTGHKNLKIVLPKDELQEKINEVLNHVNKVLNLEQVKRQEKYLINLKESNLIPILEINKKQKIVQDYLVSEENEEVRVRKVTFDGSISYYLSVFNIKDDGKKVLAKERILSEKEYEGLLQYKDNRYKTIVKNRYYFSNNGSYMYLDIFDGDLEVGILEINVNNNEVINMPEYLSVIDKVSNREEYQNKNIALKDNKKRVLI